jgi:hypothetical protein
MSETYTLPIEKQDENLGYLLAEAGDTGLKRNAGQIDEEWLRQLSGEKAVRVFTEMRDNDSIIGAGLLIFEMLLRQTPWHVEPANDSEEARQVADFVSECLEDMEGGFGGFMSDFLSLLPFGWAYHEKVFKVRQGPDAPVKQLRSKYDDGRIGWRKWAIRSQDSLERWDLDDHGDVLAMIQNAPPKYETKRIPREKALHFRLRKFKNNPEGYSILRPLYLAYYYKKQIATFEAIGIERSLNGVPVMQLPPEILHPQADASQRAVRQEYETMIRQIKKDENWGLVIPSETGRDGNPTGYKFELMSISGSDAVDTNAIINRYDSRLAIGLMIQFVLLGQQDVGSRALADNNTALLSVGLGTILDMRDEEINEHAIPELVSLNGWDPSLAPALVHGDIETPDLQQLSQYVNTLAGSGALIVDDKLEEHLRDLGSLPQRDMSTVRPVTQPARDWVVDENGQGQLFDAG